MSLTSQEHFFRWQPEPWFPTEELLRLKKWLYPKLDFDPTSLLRFAPSIILRSEAELLGVSSPRFAVRAKLSLNSFVNVRRREELARSVMAAYEDSDLDLASLHERICNSSWIADSLLEPPEDYGPDYHILQSRLHALYGETAMASGTPFVTHMLLGGGLCAQATCFMALALATDAKVYGIAEITKLATSATHRLGINGLNAYQITSFFRDCIPSTGATLQQLTDENAKQIERLGDALRAYLQSNCPVIVPLSCSRVFGQHIVTPNAKHRPMIETTGEIVIADGRRKVPLPKPKQLRTMLCQKGDLHAILLVGCHRAHDEFIYNDPATYPFLRASLTQLFNARPYVAPPSKGSDRPLLESDLEKFQFIPVTPAGVRLPLLDVNVDVPDLEEPEGKRQEVRMGLLTAISKELKTGKRSGLKYRVVTQSSLRLIRCPGKGWGRELAAAFGIEPIPLDSIPDCLPNQYYWVYYLPCGTEDGDVARSLWFWNAQIPVPPDCSSATALAAVFVQQRSGNWTLQTLRS